MMKLSILDFVTVFDTDTQAIANMLELVELADTLGYERYWFTEHHSMPQLLSTAPDLMIAMALHRTKRIHLGAGGIMLPNHAALKVAENFRVLSSAIPGRIDLGLGRAPGTNPLTAVELSRSKEVASNNDFDQQLTDLQNYLDDDASLVKSYNGIQLPGVDRHNPNIFMLGSSQGGLQYALKHNYSFVFAGHINSELMTPVLNYFNEHKRADLKSIAAIGVVCAKTDEQAQYLAEPYIHMWVMRMSGLGRMERLSLEAANAYSYSEYELMVRDEVLEKLLIGSVETLEKKFETLLEETGADEIMMVDCYSDHESKIEAYKLLAPLLDA